MRTGGPIPNLIRRLFRVEEAKTAAQSDLVSGSQGRRRTAYACTSKHRFKRFHRRAVWPPSGKTAAVCTIEWGGNLRQGVLLHCCTYTVFARDPPLKIRKIDQVGMKIGRESVRAPELTFAYFIMGAIMWMAASKRQSVGATEVPKNYHSSQSARATH